MASREALQGPHLTRRQFLYLAALAAAGLLLPRGRREEAVFSCTRPSTRRLPRHTDLLALLSAAEIAAPDPAYVQAGDPVPVAGEFRPAIFAHAPSTITFPPLLLHQDGRLDLGLGIHRGAWERPGDGVTFLLEGVAAGQRYLLLEQHLDPYHRPEDRRWVDLQVDLSDLAGREVQFVLRTEAGQNNANDWAAWSAPLVTSWEEAAEPFPERPNILLITLDTVRADHLSVYGYPRRTTPWLDRLAEEGVRFSRAYSHSEHTNPSHLTMLTGLYPRSHGVLDNYTPVPNDLETLAERLQRLGYHTVGAVSAFHLGPALGMDRGFDRFYPTEKERQAGGITTDVALEWLIEERREPFFLWVHYFDPHALYRPPHPYNIFFDPAPPYAPTRRPLADLSMPEDWANRYGDWPFAGAGDLAEVIAQYDGAIAYVDAQVRCLLAYLEAHGLADRTLLCVTADHGEGFGEHGVALDHFGLHEEMVHVPLLFWAPGRLPAGRVVSDLVGQIDLAPTLLDLLGERVPAEMPGHPLPLEGGRYRGNGRVVSQQHRDLSLALRTEEWRLILHQADDATWPRYPLQAGTAELYDLRTDPEEQENLWPADDPAARRALRSLSQALLDWESAIPFSPFTERPSLDEETEEMLRRLGY